MIRMTLTALLLVAGYPAHAANRAADPGNPTLDAPLGTGRGGTGNSNGALDTLTILGRTAAERAQDILNVKDAPYYAKCDGVTDDTLAISKAIAAAEARLNKTDYWEQSTLPEVFAPPGICITSGIVIHRPIWLHGSGASATLFQLKAGANVSTIKVMAELQTDPLPWATTAQPKLSDFGIDGNSSNQTGTSHGIELADAGYRQGVRYGAAARISDINIYGVKNHGIYVGQNRNFGWMDRIIINYAKNDCIYFNGNNDWDLSGLSVGACGWNGIELYYAGQIKINNLDDYNNAGDAIKATDGFGGYLFISNATIGASCGNGINISPSTVVNNAYVGLSNIQLVDDSLCKNDTASHIYVRNLFAMGLSNIIFQHSYKTGNNAKYLIDNDATSRIQAPPGSLTYVTSGAYTPYVTAPFANQSLIQGQNGVSCAGLPSAAYTVTGGIVTHC